MNSQVCRFGEATLDVAAAAGWYSAIAGLLAGFALLAILIPLDHTEDEADAHNLATGVTVFTAAFFTLLILSFTYAGLSGRGGSGFEQGLAAHEKLLNGAALSMATLLLLFALRSILGAYEAARSLFVQARSMILTVTAVVGPLIALSFQFSNALDIERYRVMTGRSTCGALGLPAGVWINLGIVVAGWLSICILWALRDRIKPVPKAASVVAWGVLTLTVVISAWTSIVLPMLDVTVATSQWFEHFVIAATALGSSAVAAASWASR